MALFRVVCAVLFLVLSGLPARSEETVLEKYAQSGDAESQFLLGLQHFNAKSYDNALNWLTRASDSGNAKAKNVLGNMFNAGMGVSQDKAKAISFWQEAADKGIYAAQYNLGQVYFRGDGTAQNFPKALEMFQKASANPEYSWPQYWIGVIHENGLGVAKNMDEAVKWYELSAKRGFGDAAGRLGVIAEEGLNGKADPKSAQRWYVLAVSLGHKPSQQKLSALQAKSGAASAEDGKSASVANYADRPKKTYKGVTLVGSGYPDVNDEEFFNMLSKAIDMVGQMPAKPRADAEMVGEVIYDPPSKMKLGKETGDPRTPIPDQFDVDPKRKKPGIVHIGSSIRFRSPIDIAVYNLHKNGRAARTALEAKEIERQLAGGGLSSGETAAKRERLAHLKGGVLANRSNPKAYLKEHCAQMQEEFQVLKALDAPSQMRDALAKIMQSRSCA
ncbi:MAG: sel1 repeat family protein [Rhodospirillales bacterium]|nr:MAG: sel1 repeat family protein [Rhodospirillales bacterium]